MKYNNQPNMVVIMKSDKVSLKMFDLAKNEVLMKSVAVKNLGANP